MTRLGAGEAPRRPKATVAKILDELGVRLEREDHLAQWPEACVSDFYLPDHHHTLEIDGYSIGSAFFAPIARLPALIDAPEKRRGDICSPTRRAAPRRGA